MGYGCEVMRQEVVRHEWVDIAKSAFLFCALWAEGLECRRAVAGLGKVQRVLVKEKKVK